MTSTAGCRGIRQSLGVYVLGAIDPAERVQVDEHLATCLDCREELAALAGLPALLRKIPLTEAERIAEPELAADDGPPEELLHSLLARTTQVRRARRWRGLVAAAAAVVVALGGGAVAMNAFQPAGAPAAQGQAQDQIHWHIVTHTDAATGAWMSVRYTPRPWGTLLNVQVNGIPPGTDCALEVVNTAGQRLTVGDWRVSYTGGQVWYPASTSVSDASLRNFQLTSGGRTLVKVPVAPES
jgi:anti-sigma factor RsiW